MTNIRRLKVLGLVLIFLLVAVGISDVWAQNYRLIDLGTLGAPTGNTTATSINNSNRVVGYSYTATYQVHAFLYDGGPLVDLGTLGGTWSEAVDINNYDIITGNSTTTISSERMPYTCTYTPQNGATSLVGVQALLNKTVKASNNFGDLVGDFYVGTGQNSHSHAFLYKAANNQVLDLGDLGIYSSSSALNINDLGHVIGYGVSSDGVWHAFLYKDNTFTDLGNLGGTYVYPYGINEAGDIVGVSTASPVTSNAFIYSYSNGIMQPLPNLGTGTQVAYSINNYGQVVGLYSTTKGYHGFIWTGGNMVDLNDLISHNEGGLEITRAKAINDNGWIVGEARSLLREGEQRAFLLIPSGTSNRAPIVNAGPDQVVNKGELVTLDGSLTTDPEGQTLSFAWSFLRKPPGSSASLSNPQAVGPTFLADKPGEYLLKLTVTDSQGGFSCASVKIDVRDPFEWQITNNQHDNYPASISGDLIAYTLQGYSSYENQIWYYNLASNINSLITNRYGYNNYPAVSGDRIAFQGTDEGGYYSILLYSTALPTVTAVAVGDGGRILTSNDDGVTWTLRTSGTNVNLYSVAHGNNTFIAVGEQGTIVRSTDGGTTWTAGNVGTQSLNAVIYIPQTYNTFVAAGNAGTLLVSTDGGQTWASKSSGTGKNLYGLGYNVSAQDIDTKLLFVATAAVGENGAILVSNDLGENWYAMTSGTTQALYAVDSFNWGLVAAGANGTIRYLYNFSPTSTWEQGNTDTNKDLYAFLNSGSLVFGKDGAFLEYDTYHPNTKTWRSKTTWTASTLNAAARNSAYPYRTNFIVGDGGALFTTGDFVTFTSRDSLGTANLNGVAYGYNVENLTGGLGGQSMFPSISGNLVVWETRSGNPIVSEIRGVDLSNHEERVIASSTTSIYRYPRVSNTNIVWQSCVGSLCDVFGYDWATRATRQITTGGSGSRPDIDRTVAVYQVTRGGENDICAFDLVAGTEKCLSLPGEQGYPRISGNYVVFNDTEPDYTMHLRLWHLGLDKVFDITTGYSSSQLLPDIDGNKVVYSDDRNGSLDIYLYEIHLPPTAYAGPDQLVNLGTSAVLSASGTDPDQEYPLTYYWSIVSKPSGSVAAIADPQLKDISFTPDLPGTYTLSLVTVDAMGIPSEADEVTITAQRLPAEIEVSPLSWNFGEVKVGSSSSVVITISNLGGSDLGYYYQYQTGGCTDISVPGPLPPSGIYISLPPGQSAYVNVVYTPSALGTCTRWLQILSTDADESTVVVQLSGKGVSAEVPPSQQAADILAFFDQSVSNGTLTGQGPGNSASGKLNALRNMIAAAASLINQGGIAGACQQLLDAYRKTDGNPKPPDFVTGPAASELAAKIQALRQSLGCP